MGFCKNKKIFLEYAKNKFMFFSIKKFKYHFYLWLKNNQM